MSEELDQYEIEEHREPFTIDRIAKIVAVKAGSSKVYHVDPAKFVEAFPSAEVAWEEERGVWNSTGPNESWACFTIYLRD